MPINSGKSPPAPSGVRYVAPLTAYGRYDIAVVGGKAANLGELVRAGFPVPPGYVLTTAAYRAHLWAGGAQRRITALGSGRSRGAAAVRDAILDAEVPPEVAEAIRSAYRALGGGAISVRSSATAEDLAGAAFAGQQDTYLNVVGADAVVDAVRDCWASLWNDRAVEYRRQQRLAGRTVEIAVVLQRMVPAELAGVLFTANPVTGERGQAVLDASPGLGEAVVSGAVVPDHYELAKRSRRLTAYRRGDSPVPAPRRLTRDEARRLVRLGTSAERLFRSPQDIEWAIAAGRLYVLQARPLTALPPPPAREPWSPARLGPARRLRGVATQLIGELAPERPYPIDDSTWCTAILGALGDMAAALGVRLPTFAEVCTREDGVITRIRPPAPRPTPSLLTAPVRLALLAARYDPLRWRSEPLIDTVRATARAWEGEDLRAKPAAGLLDLLRAALDLPTRTVGDLRVRYLPRAALAALALVLLARVAGYRGSTGALLAGTPTMTSEANQELEGLAALVRADRALAARFAATAPADLPAALPDFPVFQAEFDDFLARNGHRETTILLVTEPTWKDAPEQVLGLIKALAADAPRPHAPVRADAVGELLDRPVFRFGPLRELVAVLVPVAKTLFQVREDTHFLATVSLPTVRRVIREFGRRLVELGALDTVEDVYHLRLDELDELAAHWPPPAADLDRIRRIALRRKDKRAALADTPYRDSVEVAAVAGALLRGAPASAGVAEGPVRVVHGPAEFDRLHDGDILVAPFTTPAWTPLFRRAAAVIADAGGAGSHAAIVAREYGIPAVMGTGDATTRLVDGQRIRVDGRSGLVTALGPIPSSDAVAGAAVVGDRPTPRHADRPDEPDRPDR